MSVRTISVEDFGARLRFDAGQISTAMVAGMRAAALIGEGIVAADTPVDTGLTRNQWGVAGTPRGADLFNDSPIAGILELGSRPHRPPFIPILRWVVRKFGTGKRSFEDPSEVDNPELWAIAWGTVKAIERHGTKPNYMVRDNLDRLNEIARREVERRLEAEA